MLTHPAIIWGIDFTAGEARAWNEGDWALTPAADPATFRWLHLNLADAVTQQWIAGSAQLPEQLKEMLLSPERHQRAVVEGEYVGCVLHDVERDFDRIDAERTGALRIALGPRMIVTARHHPLRSADIARSKIERGARVSDSGGALGLAVSSIIEHVTTVARDQASEIESFEDALLDRPETFDHRKLIDIRRRVVQFHRLLSGMHAVFKRLEGDEDLPEPLQPTIERLAQQLSEIDSDMVAIQGQLRLLREEADLQSSQRTNQNLYVLSILSALLLPATLVTGFFGMNTGGLPFASEHGGTVEATVLALMASGGVYALLRMLGLVHRL